MEKIILSNDSSEDELKRYFLFIMKQVESGVAFPVNLEYVWPLIYSAKEKAVRALVSDTSFIQDVDYEVLAQNGENLQGGRPVNLYNLSVSCLEYFVARKVRRVFNVYRDVFHSKVKAVQEPAKAPVTYLEALKALVISVEAEEKAKEGERRALEAQRVAEAEIEYNRPMVEFASTAIHAREGKDMLIREVRKRLESHGYDIAEESLRDFLVRQQFMFKRRNKWELYQHTIDHGSGKYRYNDQSPERNTIHMTEIGFQKLVGSLSKPSWLSIFKEYGGKVLKR